MANSALGRGLSALLSESALEAGMGSGAVPGVPGVPRQQAEARSLPISQVFPNPDQPRRTFDESALRELEDSIRQNGVLQPILVRPRNGGYEIVAGERRYQASKRAGLSEIPAFVKEITDDEVFKLALIENIQRNDLSPIEEARGYRKLMDDSDLTPAELAKALSKSRSAVANSLRLLGLPSSVQDMLGDGRLTAGHARALLRIPDGRAQARLAAKAANSGMSVRQVEKEADEIAAQLAADDEAGEKQPRPKKEKPPTFLQGERRISQALGGNKVRIKEGKRKNTIEIDFHDADELARILAHISE